MRHAATAGKPLKQSLVSFSPTARLGLVDRVVCRIVTVPDGGANPPPPGFIVSRNPEGIQIHP
tara:strand:- start:126 stop:314 length:189 start_codon:yes stop_codon:yes gene_type:complete